MRGDHRQAELIEVVQRLRHHGLLHGHPIGTVDRRVVAAARTLDAAQIFRVAAFDIGDLDDHLVLLAIALEAGALPESGGGLLGKATTPGMAVISKASALMIMISSWVRLRSPHGLSLRKVVPCEPVCLPETTK